MVAQSDPIAALIVARDPALLARIAEGLRERAIDVSHASSAERALELLDAQPVDLIVAEGRPAWAPAEF